MHKRPDQKPRYRPQKGVSQTSPQVAGPEEIHPRFPRQPTFAARGARVRSQRFEIFYLQVLLFPRLYADVVISSAPNSHEAKILARNYKKIVEQTTLAKINAANHINNDKTVD